MSKIIVLTPSTKDFGIKEVGMSKTVSFNIENTGTELVTISDVTSDNPVFVPSISTTELMPNFGVSVPIYFGENGRIHDSNGEFYITDQGHGLIGNTGALALLTIKHTMVTITSPTLTAGVEGNITGTSNSTSVNVYYRLSTEEDWTEFDMGVTVTAGAWTATGTISDAGTYDFKVEDSLNPSAYDQVDDVEVASAVSFDMVSAGGSHSIGIIDGLVYAWGLNTYGELGDGSTTNRTSPVAVDVSEANSSLFGKTVVSVSAGNNHSLALCDDGSVHAWGQNTNGKLGDGSTTNRAYPVAVDVSEANSSLFGKTVISVSSGFGFSLAVCDDGSVHAWGQNYYGEIGDGTTTSPRTSPVAVDVSEANSSLFGKTVIGVSAGNNHSLAVCDDGSVHAWGLNTYGRLGDNTTTQRTSPVAVDVSEANSSLFGKTVIGVSAGNNHSLALCDDGSVHAWGRSSKGQLGDGTYIEKHVPVAVDVSEVNSSLFGKTIVGISAGDDFSSAYCSDGSAHAWGDNGNHQLGDGSTTTRLYPIAVDTSEANSSLFGKTVVGTSIGSHHSLALCDDGSVHAWGANWSGELGDGTTSYRSYPVETDFSGA